MKISVVLSSFNGKKYIKKQLESILFQTRMPDEIIFVDDFSTDNTFQLIKNTIPKLHCKCSLIANKKNIGYVRSYAKGIQAAKFEIIVLCDQDDYWLPNKIQVIENFFLKNKNINVLISDSYLSDDSLQIFSSSLIRNINIFGNNSNNYVHGMATAFRASLKPLILPFSFEEIGHDFWIHLVGRRLKCRSVITEKLQIYRRHKNTVTNFKSDMNIWRFIEDKIKDNYLLSITYTINLLTLLLTRLTNNKALRSKYSVEINEIRDEISFLQWRMVNSKKIFPFRLFNSCRMLFRQKYKYCSGFQTFLRDIIA
jgi:glycosyltransferase involved in cell wall biosynthesis